MTGAETCALPGCSKPPFPSQDRATPHLTCGNLHHQLLMAARFHPSLPAHPHLLILDRNASGVCALPSCCDPPHPGHSWCSRSHYLLWLSNFTSRLQPDQICKLPGCTRHVFVDDNSTPLQYCGWRHCQEHVMLIALQRQQRQQPRQQDSLPSPLSSAESECGHVPSLESLVPSLRDHAFNRKSPRNIQVDEDFFLKHPWDVCSDGHSYFLIVRCNYTSKGKRVMLTKDDYHWKQQGRGTVNKSSDYTLKYFTYKKLKRKQDDSVTHHDGCTYFMDECTVEGIKDYALVRLHKKTIPHGKQLKGKPATDGQQSVAEVNDVSLQDTTLPNGDEMAVDSVFSSLSPLYGPDEIFDPNMYTEDY